MLTSHQKRDRLHEIARQRLALHPDAYARFVFSFSVSQTLMDAALLHDGLHPNATGLEAIDPEHELQAFDRRATATVDRWVAKNIKLPAPCIGVILPIRAGAEQSPLIETTEQRQKRRYEACINAGLAIETQNTYAHLPRGVGKLAKAEGISTAAFNKDVKLHIERTRSG